MQNMIAVKLLFGNDFPEKLISSACSLAEFGSGGFAWRRDEAVEVIEYCRRKKMAVLGGDVLSLGNSGLEFTYDSWYLNREKEDWNVYVDKSVKRALEYVKNYDCNHASGEDVFFYSIVAEKESETK